MSNKHFSYAVPHLRDKLMRFYSIGKSLDGPTDNRSLINHIDALKIPGAGRKTLETILPAKNGSKGAAHGNEIQHKAIVEAFLGKNTWPFPEYYDLTGKNRDKELDAFHAALDRRFNVVRFRAKGTAHSNQNVEYNPRYLSAGIKYEEGRNSLRLNVSLGVLYSEGLEDSKFPFERVATIWAKELTAEIFSEGEGPSFLKTLVPNEKSRFEELDTDNGFRFQLTVPDEIDRAKTYKAFTPYISYSPPDDDSELVVVVRSGVPHYEINEDVIKDSEDRLEAHKIARNYMNKKLQRAMRSDLELGRIQEEFVVYRMGYTHYEEE